MKKVGREVNTPSCHHSALARKRDALRVRKWWLLIFASSPVQRSLAPLRTKADVHHDFPFAWQIINFQLFRSHRFPVFRFVCQRLMFHDWTRRDAMFCDSIVGQSIYIKTNRRRDHMKFCPWLQQTTRSNTKFQQGITNKEKYFAFSRKYNPHDEDQHQDCYSCQELPNEQDCWKCKRSF